MSLSPTFDFRVQNFGLGQLIAGFIAAKLVAPARLAAARRALRAELAGLDHRALRDLGINEAGLDGFVSTWSPSAGAR